MTIKIQYKKIDELIPYINNSRTHSPEQVAQIASSIKEFGFTNPILLDAQNGIIAGHGRLQAARMLEMKEVPTIELSDLTETQKKAYIIADNKLALNANWDIELLGVEISSLKDAGFEISKLGFEVSELSDILQAFEPDPIEEIDEVNENVNFIIKCDNIAQKEDLKDRIGVKSDKIDANLFFDILAEMNG
jgi:ParB-like chromosome segregation protein Spo0J